MNVTINLQLPDVLVRLIESALNTPAAEAKAPAPINNAPVAPPPAAEAPGKPAKAARAPKAASAPSEPTAQAAVADAPAPKAEPSAPAAAAPQAAQAPSYDEVKAVLVKMTATKGREAVVDLLARYGVTRAPDLKPEVFQAVIDEAQS